MPQPARRIAALLLALALGACTRGASLPATANQGGGEQPANVALVTDIPIPASATMDTERSLILSDRDRWTGRVVMKLWQSTAEMTSFYQQQMPNFGWQPVMSVTSDISVLTYTRGDRAATVQVEKAAMWGSTVLVTVAPKQGEGGGAPAASYADVPPARPAPAERIRSEPLPPPRR